MSQASFRFRSVVFFMLLLSCMAPIYAAVQTTIIVKNQAQFTIALKSNPTTGYQWYLTQYDRNLLKLVGHHYIAPNTKLLGAPGVEKWTFLASSKHSITTEISMVSKRSWEKTVGQTVTYIIKIQP